MRLAPRSSGFAPNKTGRSRNSTTPTRRCPELLRRYPGAGGLPQTDLAPDLVKQPPISPRSTDPPRRRRAGRTTRRMGRITALPRPGRPQQIPSRPGLTDRTGGHPGGTDRLNHNSKNHTTTSYTTSLDLTQRRRPEEPTAWIAAHRCPPLVAVLVAGCSCRGAARKSRFGLASGTVAQTSLSA